MAGDIYQEIWDADQEYRGITAVLPGASVPSSGHVVVDEKKEATKEHRLLPELQIPAEKRDSYDRVARLFNNFTLDQTKPENDLPEEEQEVQEFLTAIHDSPPMEVARDYASRQLGRTIQPDEWKATLQHVWFERTKLGKDSKDVSGFEHTIVGEQKQATVSGYHFWYKYYLDENFRRPDGSEADLIEFGTWLNGAEATPDVVTLSYVWHAYDYEAMQHRPLIKPIGGFWVGPSVEGLMAMGTLCFVRDFSAPRQAVINGHRYTLRVHPGGGDKSTLRSFYPEYVAPADPAPAEALARAAAEGLGLPAAAERLYPPQAGVITRAGLHFIDPATGELIPVRGGSPSVRAAGAERIDRYQWDPRTKTARPFGPPPG
jgi:poly(U)-specific endoribonuclease